MMKENIHDIERRIHAACDRAGRDYSEVTLIAVSKTKSVSMIKEAYELGMRHFGENKVQELSEKCDILQNEFEEPVYWHQIGHLQRNKVKYIVDKAVLIHSVDSMRLAQQIEEEATKKGIHCDVLIEVNIAKEATKFGVLTEEVMPLLTLLSKLTHIRVRGLMAIAPYSEDPEKNREYFKNLRELYVDIKTKNIDNKGNKVQDKISMEDIRKGGLIQVNAPDKAIFNDEKQKDYFNILSMGMTGDFEVAIEEGATMVRIGTGIFGERNYSEQLL